MPKEWCQCDRFSCEKITIKVDDGYKADFSRRYMMVKNENGAITSEMVWDDVLYKSGSKVENSIENCEIKKRVDYKDELGEHNNAKIKPDLTQIQPEVIKKGKNKEKSKKNKK